MQLHILDSPKGEVAIDSSAVVGIIPAESPIGEHVAVLLAGGHKVVVTGSLSQVRDILSQPQVDEDVRSS
jgi:hypothetical protein